MKHSEHRILFAENLANGSGGMDAQRLQFAQQEQAENMVNIGIGQHNARNWRLAYTTGHTVAWMKVGRTFNLRAQVWGSSQEKPGVAILTDGNLGLGARLALECASPEGTAIGTGAIPLGKSATCSRAQDFHAHVKGVYNGE
jgi:hypothetical protein